MRGTGSGRCASRATTATPHAHHLVDGMHAHLPISRPKSHEQGGQMPTVDQSSCPRCGTPGALALGEALVAEPLGSFSVPGAQIKITARGRPILTCSACGLHRVGEYDSDRQHVTFPADTADEDPQPGQG